MSANNSIRIIGRMGRAPELRESRNGTPVANVSVAVDNRYNDTTDWFRCVFFGETAQITHQYGDKGRLVALEGEMHQNRWIDDGGNDRTSWELTARSIQFLDKAPDSALAKDDPVDVPEEDIPF